jgi:hypothetical protein
LNAIAEKSFACFCFRGDVIHQLAHNNPNWEGGPVKAMLTFHSETGSALVTSAWPQAVVAAAVEAPAAVRQLTAVGATTKTSANLQIFSAKRLTAHHSTA